jgi:hypothetical protein
MVIVSISCKGIRELSPKFRISAQGIDLQDSLRPLHPMHVEGLRFSPHLEASSWPPLGCAAVCEHGSCVSSLPRFPAYRASLKRLRRASMIDIPLTLRIYAVLGPYLSSESNEPLPRKYESISHICNLCFWF